MPAKSYPISGDPRLKTKSYKAIVKYWRTVRQEHCEAPRCLLRGVPIRYAYPRTSASLDVGHILPRDQDTRTVWQIEDTRPEHQLCNRSAGTGVKQARANARRPARPDMTGPELSATPDEW